MRIIRLALNTTHLHSSVDPPFHRIMWKFHQIHQEEEDTVGLVIMYADNATIHRALGLAGAPVPQGGTEAESGEAFQQYVFSQLVSAVPDRVLHCVEDVQRTFGPTTEYFPNLFQKLPGRAYANLILGVK